MLGKRRRYRSEHDHTREIAFPRPADEVIDCAKPVHGAPDVPARWPRPPDRANTPMQASRCFVVLICAPSAAAAKLCPGRQSENASLPPLRKLLKKRGAPRRAYDLMPMNSVIHANPVNSANCACS